MILKVNKDICEIKQNEVWNVGDYNVHTVEVELSDEFDGLVNKVRYFVEDNSYDMLITNNVAEVPYEATLTEGTIKIGVYGYDADTDILVQSTSPVNKYITSGTYTGDADNTEPLTPTDKEQMETAIQKNTDDITDLKANKQDKLISGVNIKTINNESILSSGNLTLVAEETDPIFTNSPAYSITDEDITYWNNKANISDIPDVSNFITKDVDNLTYYTKTSDLATVASSGNYNDLTNQPNLSGFATTTELGNERTARENADIGLQEQIDAITSSSDVKDIVGTYIDLQNYDTSILGNDDIIKVLQDNTHNDAMSYYRWIISGNNGSWQYIGQEGPYYTKGETDVLFNGKQNVISNSNKIQSDLVDDTNQSNLFVTSSEKSTWNNKVDQSELTNYVEKSDYATTSKAGLVRTSNDYATQVSGTSGIFFSQTKTFSQYNNAPNIMFISKGTLENVIDGYDFITNQDINVEEYNNLLYKTLDLTNADKIFTGYIYNGAYSGNQNWRSYEFKAQNIDKIISLSAYTDSSSYKNINFYSKYCSHSSELSSYFISSVPLNEGANKINTYSNIIVPDNCEAIVISHKIQSNMETPIVSLREKKYDKEIEDINSDIKEISNSASNVKAIYKNIWNANDFIFIKDELWLAKPNSTYTGYDQEIRRYKMIDDEWVEQSKLYTDFGHWNTVDYCPENDCLIFGNGANAETTTGNYFTVVKNPLALSGSVLTQDVGIKYNVDIGFKVQAVWGNDNMGEYNIVYLTSNYTRRIVKLLLGKDANGNFDGTFITLSDTTLPTTIGTGGGDFWGDCIYIGDGANYAIWKLSVTDYTVQKIDRTAYLSDGTIISGSTQGIYIDKDYIWVFYNIGTSSNNYLVQYYRGGLTNKSVTTDAHINDLIDAKLGVIENGSY